MTAKQACCCLISDDVLPHEYSTSADSEAGARTLVIVHVVLILASTDILSWASLYDLRQPVLAVPETALDQGANIQRQLHLSNRRHFEVKASTSR